MWGEGQTIEVFQSVDDIIFELAYILSLYNNLVMRYSNISVSDLQKFEANALIHHHWEIAKLPLLLISALSDGC